MIIKNQKTKKYHNQNKMKKLKNLNYMMFNINIKRINKIILKAIGIDKENN